MRNWVFLLAIFTFIIFVFFMYNFESPLLVKLDTEAAALLEGIKWIEVFHYLGETQFIFAVGIVLLIWLWFYKGDFRGMFLVLLTYPGGYLLNQVLKRIVERPRPEMVNQLTSFSFPSGHAMLSMLYLLTLAYFITEGAVSKKKSIVVWFVATMLILLIGLSRVAGSRHYMTDVMAGWSLGYTCFVFCVLWYETRQRQSKIEDV